MKKKPHFLVALATAALAFGILWVTLGTPKYVNHCKEFRHHQGCKTEVNNTQPEAVK